MIFSGRLHHLWLGRAGKDRGNSMELVPFGFLLMINFSVYHCPACANYTRDSTGIHAFE